MKKRIAALAALMTVVALSACSGTGPSMHGEWQLDAGSVDGATIDIGAEPVTMTVAEGTIAGTAACNSYSGSISTAGERVTIGEIAATMRACTDDALMQAEGLFLAGLHQATNVSFHGGAMVLTGEDVELRFVELGR